MRAEQADKIQRNAFVTRACGGGDRPAAFPHPAGRRSKLETSGNQIGSLHSSRTTSSIVSRRDTSVACPLSQ
jgi:hypothetical protein